MKLRTALLGILALALTSGACKKKEESLSLLVWEGYADESAVQAFEESHHCKVKASYMGSSDELVAKLRGGSASNYDVISPSSDAHVGESYPRRQQSFIISTRPFFAAAKRICRRSYGRSPGRFSEISR